MGTPPLPLPNMVQFANLPSKNKDSDSENAVKMTSSNSSDQEVPNGSSSRGGGTEEGHSEKGKRSRQSRPRPDSRSWRALFEQSSNALVKIRIVRGYWVRRSDMLKLCYSSQRDTRRMSRIL